MNHTREHRERPAGESGRSEQRILRMTPDDRVAPSIEGVIRQRIDELAQAIRDKNLDHLMSFYAPDVVVFDVRPPLERFGASEYRQNFESWFASFEGRISFELADLRVVAGEGVAFCHYLSLIVGAKPGGRKTGYWARGTTCFEKRNSQWLVTHEHISMPTSM
jgi:ketosteroid isomerase-like protein